MTQEETRIYGPLPKPTEQEETHIYGPLPETTKRINTHQWREVKPSETVTPTRQSTKKKKIHAVFLTAVVLGIICLTPIAIIKSVIAYPMTSLYILIGLVLGTGITISLFALYTLWKGLYRLIYNLLY